MRWLFAVMMVAVAGPAWAQDAAAEKLFKDLEKTLRDAKTLRMAATIVSDNKAQKAEFKFDGVITMGEGDLLCSKITGDLPGAGKIVFEVTCDGKEIDTRTTPVGKPRSMPAPQGFGTLMRSLLARGGAIVVVGMQPLPLDRKSEPDDVLKVKDYKMVGKEMLGQRETVVISFVVTDADNKRPDPATVTLWLDSKTKLPVQRKIEPMGPAGGPAVIVETISEFVINQPVDAKLFVIPKEQK